MAMTRKEMLDRIIDCEHIIQKKTDEISKPDSQIAKNSNNADLSTQRGQAQKDINEAQEIKAGWQRQIKIVNLNELSSREQNCAARSKEMIQKHQELQKKFPNFDDNIEALPILDKKIQELNGKLLALEKDRKKLANTPVVVEIDYKYEPPQYTNSKALIQELDEKMSTFAAREQQMLHEKQQLLEKAQISQEKEKISQDNYQLSQDTNQIRQEKQQILQELGKLPSAQEEQQILQGLEGRLSVLKADLKADLKEDETWDKNCDVNRNCDWPDDLPPSAMNSAAASTQPSSNDNTQRTMATYDAALKKNEHDDEWVDCGEKPTPPAPSK